MQKQIFALSIAAALTVGCGPKDEATAPFSLPPQEGFVMDFSAMSTAASKPTVDALSYNDYTDYPMSKPVYDYIESSPLNAAKNGVSNHDFAAARVFGWSIVAGVVTLIPQAAFQKAFQSQPKEVSEGVWEWAYSVVVGLQTYNARLQGQVIENANAENQIQWEMYLSRGDGAFTDVNWFSGLHDVNATAGTWTLRVRDNNTGVVSDAIGITWERDTTAGTKRLRYTNLGDNGYIEYGVGTNASYDSYFNIDNKLLPAVINIEWSSADLSGRVSSNNVNLADHFDHTGWNCWAGNTSANPQADITCP